MLCLITGAVAAPAVAGLGDATGGMDYAIPWLRIVLSLLFCFVVAAGAALLLRAYKTRRLASLLSGKWRDHLITQPRIEVLESRRISTHADVCLFRHDEREYLVLVGSGHSRLLNARETEISSSQSVTEAPGDTAAEGNVI